jgi:isoleucyl-tRNA synthetase
MMDRINIFIDADAEVMGAVSQHEEHIKNETLAQAMEEATELPQVDINGHKTGLRIERI